MNAQVAPPAPTPGGQQNFPPTNATRATSATQTGGFLVPETKPHPTGTRTIRLADIHPLTRQRYARELMAHAKDARERKRLEQLATDPGDAGGRIAA